MDRVPCLGGDFWSPKGLCISWSIRSPHGEGKGEKFCLQEDSMWLSATYFDHMLVTLRHLTICQCRDAEVADNCQQSECRQETI